MRPLKNKMLKTNAMRLLESAGIPFEAFEYDTEKGIDAVCVAAYLHQPAEQIFKTLVVTDGAHAYFVFVVPATDELDLKKAAKVAGVKALSMLPQKQLFPLTGYIHGGCSPLAMKKSFPTFIDETAQLFDEIFVSGGKVGLTLSVNPERLAELIGGGFDDLTLEK